MGGVFDLNNRFYRFFTKVFWAIVFNFVFLLTSIPIITVGASYAGLYGVFLDLTLERNRDGYFKTYFRTFGKKFVPATVYWIGGLAAMLIWILDIRFFFAMEGTYGIVAGILAVAGALFSLIFINGAFAVMVKYNLGIRDTWRKTFYFIKNYPFRMFLGALWFLIIAGLVFSNVYYNLPLIWMMIMVFGLIALADSYCYNVIFEVKEGGTEEEEEQDIPEEIMKYADMSAFLHKEQKEDEQHNRVQ